ncbi:MAG: phosphomannomutase/phosphoglucomutase [Gemmatimonadetes bacterium]|nr:phosphomannomutase/phosphoglucomutase [Gemmatimonadota bacterium]MCC7132633.1 phosphomannomutase/phosphoglucomutase [Gemmatimonadales bacterium]
MNVPKNIFRQYDVRGVVDRELTPDLARALGRAFATAGWRRLGRAPVLAVGRDNRPSGDALARAVRQGIVAAGGTAIDVGMLPTPALYFAVHQLATDGGLQVTGSHNPPEFNGFKMVLAGESVHGEAILDLYDIIVTETWQTGQGTERVDGSVLDGYAQAILGRHRLARPVSVVVDCGNGVASLVAERVIRALGCEVTALFCESDGTFPNHHPDPTVPENLVDLVREVRRTGAELGIAFDGDGDRIGAVDEHGTIIFGDQLLVILGRDAVRRFGPGVPVIFDVKCSEVLPQALTAAGAKPEMWKTGHSLIKARMKELGAPLAGEMSGHIFFGGDYYGYDDALFAAARLLEIVASGQPGLHRLLADIPTTFATPEIRVDCPDDVKFGIVDKAAAHFGSRYQVNTIDGVRIAYPDGWALLRSSNTQPVLVMRFEATSEASLARYRGEMTTWLAGQGVQV